MSYDAEALLQINIISKGLNEAITGLAKLEGSVPGLEKQIGSLQRRVLSADKDVASLGKTLGTTGAEANAAAAGIAKADAATKGWSQSLSSGWAKQFARDVDVMASKIQSYEQITRAVQQRVAQAQFGFNTTALSGAELSSFSALAGGLNGIQARAEADSLRAAEQAGRGYLNTSTAIDSAIAKREAESRSFSQQLRAQMQAEADEAAAANKSAAAQLRAGQSLSTTRTSLYDASRSLALFGAATLALPVASAVVAAAYQRDFATVERSLVGSHYNADALKQDFIDLSEQIPVSFKGITDIAGAGAQLGLTAKELPAFTKTVAELTATTNLTADAAENMLGKFHAIGTVGSSQFANLASAVLNVGVHTAATEQQISTAATMIVGIGQSAGFTTPQIIGLAGALSSVSSSTRNPQLIRGTMTRFINDISNAVRTGGPALQTFADTAGVTSDEVQKSFGTAAFAGTFQKFINGLDQVQKSGGDAVGVLNALGISSVQDIPLLLNLANGHEVLATAISRANQGWNESYLLQQHFDKINDTLVSKTKELGHAFGALFNDIGQSSTGPLTVVVNAIAGIVKGLDGFVKSDFGGWVSAITVGLLTAVGVAALMFAGLSKIAAGTIAITQAWSGVTKAIDASRLAKIADAAAEDARTAAIAQGLGVQDADAAATAARTAVTNANTVANDANASSSKRLLAALSGVGKVLGFAGLAVGGLALAGSLTSALDKNTIAQNGYNTNTIKGNVDLLTQPKANNYKTGVLQSAITPEIKNSPDIATRRAGVNVFGGLFDPEAQAIKDFDEKLAGLAAKGPKEFGTIGAAITSLGQKTGLSFNEMKAAFPSLTGELDKLGFKVKETADGYQVYAGSAATAADKTKALALTFQAYSGLDPKGAKALGESYAKSVQTLTDFNTVMSTVQTNLKNADSDYDGVTVSVAQFTDQMNKNNQAQSTWFGNLTTLKQQVIDQTGDADTASQITGQLLQAGYSVTNASFLQQLVDAAPDQRAAYIKAMQDSMNATAQAAGQALIDAAGGHLVSKDGSPLDSTAIGKMLLGGWSPADIMKALNLQLVANPAKPQVDPKDANQKLDDLVTKYGGMAITFQANADTGPAQNHIDSFIAANSNRKINVIVNYQGVNQGYVAPGGKNSPSGATGGYFTGTAFQYSTGGPVFGAGTGTSDSVPAWLSNGEFVIKASSVRSLGVGYLQALNKYGSAVHRATGGPVSRGFSPVGHYANGGPVTALLSDGVLTVQLSPIDRQLLSEAGNLTLRIGDKDIARATATSNAVASSRG